MSGEVGLPASGDAGSPSPAAGLPLPGTAALPLPAAAVGQPAPAQRRRRADRVIALVVLLVAGIAGVCGGGTALVHELTRGPTSAEKAAAVQEEIASRWQRLSATEIFPATLGYQNTDAADGIVAATARRVGIARPANCAAAVDPAVAGVLRRNGCVTVLRASYVDDSGTLAVTVGIAVMPSTQAASNVVAAAGSWPAGTGVRPFALPGTVLNQFGDAQRGYFSGPSSTGPYVFLAADGYTDGRPGSGPDTYAAAGTAEDSLAVLEELNEGVEMPLQDLISAQHSACAMRDIRC